MYQTLVGTQLVKLGNPLSRVIPWRPREQGIVARFSRLLTAGPKAALRRP
jgi:hypothetical protein